MREIYISCTNPKCPQKRHVVNSAAHRYCLGQIKRTPIQSAPPSMGIPPKPGRSREWIVRHDEAAEDSIEKWREKIRSGEISPYKYEGASQVKFSANEIESVIGGAFRADKEGDKEWRLSESERLVKSLWEEVRAEDDDRDIHDLQGSLLSHLYRSVLSTSDINAAVQEAILEKAAEEPIEFILPIARSRAMTELIGEVKRRAASGKELSAEDALPLTDFILSTHFTGNGSEEDQKLARDQMVNSLAQAINRAEYIDEYSLCISWRTKDIEPLIYRRGEPDEDRDLLIDSVDIRVITDHESGASNAFKVGEAFSATFTKTGPDQNGRHQLRVAGSLDSGVTPSRQATETSVRRVRS